MEVAVCIIVFLILLFLIGLFVSKRIKNDQDWFVAGRNLGVVPLVGTYFATIISAVSVIGYFGYYYSYGWAGWWNWAGTALTSMIAALWFAEKLRKFGQTTLPDLLAARYGKVHSIIAGIVILVAMLFFTSAQLTGSAAVVTTSMGIDRTTAIIVIGTIFILFTVMGGMEAVAWTDTFCSAIILIGVWLLSYNAVNEAGGVVKIHKTLAQIKPSALDPFANGAIPLGVAMSWFLTWGIGNIGAPQFSTRIYSAKDPKTAALSQAWTGITFIFFYLPLMLAALAGIVLFPGLTGAADTYAPTIIQKVMGPWGGGIMMAGILAASISTADSVLLLAGTTFVRDIVQRCSSRQFMPQQTLKMARITTFIIGILAIFFTIRTNQGVMWVQANAVGYMGSMLSVVVLAAFAWKRANAQGALAAMIVGILTAAIWGYLNRPFGWFPILPSLFTCTLTLVIVSKLTPPPSQKVIDQFFKE